MSSQDLKTDRGPAGTDEDKSADLTAAFVKKLDGLQAMIGKA